MSDDFYESDTSSVPRGDGVRDLILTDRWNTPLGTPNGGYLLATMLRGLGDELASASPLVASVSYLSAPRPGPAQLRVGTLKRGRRVQTGEAELVIDGRVVAHLVASFGARGGRSLELGTPPRLPAPAACHDPFADARPDSTLLERVDYRVPEPAVPGGSGVPRLELWQRLAGGRVPDLTALGLLVDSCAPPVMELGESSMTVQLTVHFHRAPVGSWVATRLSTEHVVDGFHEEDCELWDEDGNLLAQSRQLGILL